MNGLGTRLRADRLDWFGAGLDATAASLSGWSRVTAVAYACGKAARHQRVVWVLIIMLVGPQGGTAVDHVAFVDKASCEAARDATLKEWSGNDSHVYARAICVPNKQ